MVNNAFLISEAFLGEVFDLIFRKTYRTLNIDTMNTIDLVIFIAYCALILFVGLFVSRKKKGEERDAGDYFLAGRGLAWWAIGASIIASNISAEQFVGMSGSGYAIGLAMATYEWIAALGLIIVAKYFIPIFLEKKIFTMPQFLEERFDKLFSGWLFSSLST